MITSILQNRGHVIAAKTVGNYMQELGIKAIWVSPYKRTTIDPDFDIKLKNILDRRFLPCSMGGRHYLCMYSKRIRLLNNSNGPILTKGNRLASFRYSFYRRSIRSHQ